MLRAARFAAKLDFDVHPETAAPIPEMADLIDGVPAARLFDEFLKMFQSGHALASYRHLRKLGLFSHLFPATQQWLGEDAANGSSAHDMIERALENTDQRIVERKPITPMFLFGVFLWMPVQSRAAELMAGADGYSEAEALIAATSHVSSLQAQRIALPRRFSFPMQEMLQLQPRFLKKKGRRAMNLLSHRRFRAAYDLMLLRAAVGEVAADVADFWTNVQDMSTSAQRRVFGLKGRGHRPSRSTAPSH